jgi:hypothetical protein
MKAQRKKKEAKKKESRGLWKLPQPWKSTKVAFGDLSMTSTAAWKNLRKKRSGFSTVTTGPATINYLLRGPLSFDVSHVWGSLQCAVY